MFEKAHFFVFGVAFVCIFLTIIASTAKAGESPGGETHSVAAARAVDSGPVHQAIADLFAAVKARDADDAYGSTTGHVHERFKSAKEFLKQMRFEFRPLYNYEAYTFLESHNIDNGVIQKVRVDDRYGDSVIMIYRLQKQESGGYLIESFSMIGGEARPI